MIGSRGIFTAYNDPLKGTNMNAMEIEREALVQRRLLLWIHLDNLKTFDVNSKITLNNNVHYEIQQTRNQIAKLSYSIDRLDKKIARQYRKPFWKKLFQK